VLLLVFEIDFHSYLLAESLLAAGACAAVPPKLLDLGDLNNNRQFVDDFMLDFTKAFAKIESSYSFHSI
jgi:hypothetical protein